MRPDNQEPAGGKADGDPRDGARADGAGTDGGATDGGADDLEREIRRGRAFSLAEAVGRAAAGSLKGASPVPAARQVLLAAEALLEARLDDPDGALAGALLARLADEPPLLDRHRDDAPGALREVVDRALAGEAALAELVRETDARWGRLFDERPRFEVPGRPADDDDPYTLAGVRERLSALRRALGDASAPG